MFYEGKDFNQPFDNNFKSFGGPSFMQHLLPQLQKYKERIPEFIMKLYHILQKKQHEDYLTWFGEDEILIKHSKKFQQKVLPKYFRHKHLSSFIRQLNMYKFSKVSKILKQKNHMYFKNPYFKRGQIELLLQIKRNTKKNRGTEETILPEKIDEMSNSQNVSINQNLPENEKESRKLSQYKSFVKNSASQIQEILSKLGSNPQIQNELKPIMFICEELMQVKKEQIQSFGIGSSNGSYDQLSLLNCSQRILPKMQAPLIFPSQCSLYNFNSLNKL